MLNSVGGELQITKATRDPTFAVEWALEPVAIPNIWSVYPPPGIGSDSDPRAGGPSLHYQQ